MNNFGLRLKQLREKEELSQTEFAIKCGFKFASKISKYENGENKPKNDFLDAIEKAFPKTNMEWLKYGIGQMEEQKHIAEEPGGFYVAKKPETDNSLIIYQEKIREHKE